MSLISYISNLSFSTSDGGKTFTRRTFGVEAWTQATAQNDTTDGLCAFHSGAKIILPHNIPVDTFKAYITSAWIRLRHQAPIVAVRSCLAPRTDFDFAADFVYDVPMNLGDVEEWANETIKFTEKKMAMSDRESNLYETYWKPSTNRYSHELVVGPDVEERKWHILFHACHAAIDARGSLQLCELLLDYLTEYIIHDKPTDTPVEVLEWGKEVVRLPPAAVLAAVKAAGLEESKVMEIPAVPAQHLAQPILYLHPAPPLEPAPDHAVTTIDLVLTEAETMSVRGACRAHGYSVTQFLFAVKALTEVEWSLTKSLEHESLYKPMLKHYAESTHFPSVLNIVDQRIRLGEYNSHKTSTCGSPGVLTDGFPLLLAMDPIRKALKYDPLSLDSDKKIQRHVSKEIFWHGVVKNSKESWQSEKIDVEAFIAREIRRTATAKDFTATVDSFMMTGLFTSSIGDIDQMKICEAYSPINSKAALGPRILVDGFVFAVRVPTPMKMVIFWQWNNRLTIRPISGAKYTSHTEMSAFIEIFKAWIVQTCCI
ncbi:hypothetical protein BT96DRAFT_928144 [Gymnopus androsaceus JB14]|uniref:Condensation domain-containing protein n=1 Tax=Gymnopus androsaceus JB14 TaxID=1447944 RepID=A0A6A4GL76_9AGAR|nr:hypothetical protein BT96DRAFT_928144 [Gymnopus androsaceus JB14]